MTKSTRTLRRGRPLERLPLLQLLQSNYFAPPVLRFPYSTVRLGCARAFAFAAAGFGLHRRISSAAAHNRVAQDFLRRAGHRNARGRTNEIIFTRTVHSFSASEPTRTKAHQKLD